MPDLTIAIIQSSLHWENVGANLAMFEEKIWSIDEEVDLILLPENFNAGFTENVKRIAEVPGLKTHKWLLQMASQKKSLVGGSYLVNENGKLYNRFFMAFPDGSYQTNDKRHLFNLSDVEKALTPTKRRNIIEYKGWKICPLICYDLRFPVWSKNIYDAEAERPSFDLLTYVANWPKPRIKAWDTLLQARAIENQCYVAATNRLGTDGSGAEYVGHSGVYDFTGEQMAFLANEEGVLIQTISKKPLVDFQEKLPFLKDADGFDIKI